VTYREALAEAMKTIADCDPEAVFIGYNTRCGNQAGGTLEGIEPGRLIETPVAENLMAGVAIGMALKGYRPVVYFERFDFILNAMDAIVNHVDKLQEISRGQFSASVIFRVVVGNTQTGLISGPTHTQDFTDGVSRMVSFRVQGLYDARQVKTAYLDALLSKEPIMLVEYKDLYDTSRTAEHTTH
jgi:pyruvate/2-oxoglutarate/acetoin dehydrogenase E1 component